MAESGGIPHRLAQFFQLFRGNIAFSPGFPVNLADQLFLLQHFQILVHIGLEESKHKHREPRKGNQPVFGFASARQVVPADHLGVVGIQLGHKNLQLFPSPGGILEKVHRRQRGEQVYHMEFMFLLVSARRIDRTGLGKRRTSHHVDGIKNIVSRDGGILYQPPGIVIVTQGHRRLFHKVLIGDGVDALLVPFLLVGEPEIGHQQSAADGDLVQVGAVLTEAVPDAAGHVGEHGSPRAAKNGGHQEDIDMLCAAGHRLLDRPEQLAVLVRTGGGYRFKNGGAHGGMPIEAVY